MTELVTIVQQHEDSQQESDEDEVGIVVSASAPIIEDMMRHSDDNLEVVDCSLGQKPLLAQKQKAPKWVWWSFACLWCGGTWPYQSVVQAQNYYVVAFDAHSLVLVVLLCFTWALFAAYCILTLSGLAHRFSIRSRVQASFILSAGVGLTFIIQDLTGGTELGRSFKIGLVAVIAVVIGISQTLCEPALFALASSLSDPACTQAIMFGNASAGLVVSAVAIMSRVISSGEKSFQQNVEDLRRSTRFFFTIEMISCLFCIMGFRLLMRSDYMKQSTLMAEKHIIPFHLRITEMKNAFWYVVPLGICQFLTLCSTLLLWPAFVSAGCPLGRFAAIKSLYFLIIVAAFNIGDFAARAWPPLLQWFIANVSTRGLVMLTLARLSLLPLFVFTVNPRIFPGEAGNWVAIAATLVLGLTNGLISTSGMMMIPSRCTPSLVPAGVYVTMSFLYLGLAVGATSGYLVALYRDPISCLA